MKQIIPAVFLLFLCACSFSTSYKELATTVDEYMVPIQDSRFPKFMDDVLTDRKVLLLGEQPHCTQEQPEFICSLLPTLHKKGYRTLLCESYHAYSWISEDYVLGSLNAIPTDLRAFEGLLLDGVRQFNASLPPSERIRVQQIDVNHSLSAFFTSLGCIERQIDTEDLFSGVRSALDLNSPGSAQSLVRYRSALEALQSRLGTEKERLEKKWGTQWHGRILELVEVEKTSVGIRKKFNNNLREKQIIELADRRIGETRGRVVINVGGFHAQKQASLYALPLQVKEWLGEHIQRQYPSCHIAFGAAQGRYLENYDDTKSVEVKPPSKFSKKNLFRILSEKSNGQTVALPLDSAVFEKRIWVHNFWVKPRDQFDAYILFPHISPLKSLELLHSQGPANRPGNADLPIGTTK
jgi:erythromycin esterase-like protein